MIHNFAVFLTLRRILPDIKQQLLRTVNNHWLSPLV